MPERLRHLSFIELLNNVAYFRQVFRDIVDETAQKIGGTRLFWDEDALRDAFSEWKAAYAEWLLSFHGEMSRSGVSDPADLQLSHIKSMGLLLETLTQFGHEPIRAANVEGVLPEQLKLLVEGFPNETFCFLGCYFIFCFQQGERDAERTFDPTNPPMHFRFLRSMVAYLRQAQSEYGGTPHSKDDFYMLFKAMDLFGMNEDYGSQLRLRQQTQPE